MQPTLIKWASPVDPSTLHVYQELQDAYQIIDRGQAEDPFIPGPHIMLTGFHYIMNENTFPSNHLIVPDDNYWVAMEDPLGVRQHDVYGLLPAWEIVPIDDDLVQDLFNEIEMINATYNAYLLDYCECSIAEEISYDKRDTAYVSYLGHEEKCIYPSDKKDGYCSCGEEPTLAQLYYEFWENNPSLTKDFSYPFSDAVKEAEKSHLYGWQRIHDVIQTLDKQGVSCFSWYLHQRSPYLPSLGPVKQTQLQLHNFINSETQQAS